MATAIKKTLLPSGVALVTLDLPDSKMNLLGESVMRELNDVLDQVAGDSSVKGLVFISGKDDNFVAGADVKEIKALQNQPSIKAYEAAKMGKMILAKIEALPINTVAAINGICLGGGTELSLACKFRIATNSSKTKIGLPEIQLGFLPGWGGCIRLPRLIGIQEALKIITTGGQVDANKAWTLGLVDEIVAPAELAARAEQVALSGQVKRGKRAKSFKDSALEDTGLGRKLLASQALPLVKSKSKGFLAPFEAAKVIINSYNQTLEEAYEAESQAFGRLAVTTVSKNLVGIWAASTDSKRMPEGFAPSIKVKKVGVLGAGVMGAGIAQAAAHAGYDVVLKDIKPEFVEKGMATIKGLFDGLVEKGKYTRAEADAKMAAIKGTTDFADLSDCDLVVEAVVEIMKVKQEVLAELERVISKPFIFATNTSSLSVTTMGINARHPESVLGLHFFNPVHKMPLVEVVKTDKTSEEAAALARGFAMKLGKTVVTTSDAPGFVVNRILAPYLREAILLMQEGVPLEDIEKAMKDFGMPMGPLELLDEVGLDISEKVIHVLHEALGDRMSPPAIMEAINALKIVGRKGGKGIYVYDAAGGRRKSYIEKVGKGWRKKKIKKYVFNPDVVAAIKAPRNPKTAGEIRDRLVLAMVNEAARVMEEHIVSDPSQLDLAMIYGTGFPPFTGGLLRYADQTGLKNAAQKLTFLSQVSGANYAPANLLTEKASKGSTFYQN
jgi:3-hydroxyacyl-CoA dehydrogenase / enoyl-CoA hydratase / 3-hydroxybutyryl-CoA epimerase